MSKKQIVETMTILAIIFITLIGAMLVTPGKNLSLGAKPSNYKILRVIDGDTIEFEANFLPNTLKPKLSLKVKEIDTPEKGHRAKCSKEKKRAEAASNFTITTLQNSEQIYVDIKEWDKYGGRVLGDLNIDGKLLSELLIKNNFAKPYSGQGPKTHWCKYWKKIINSFQKTMLS